MKTARNHIITGAAASASSSLRRIIGYKIATRQEKRLLVAKRNTFLCQTLKVQYLHSKEFQFFTFPLHEVPNISA